MVALKLMSGQHLMDLFSNASDLGAEIAKKAKGTSTTPAELGDISGLVFSIISPTVEPWQSPSIQFSLKGHHFFIAQRLM
jgi:hypothetical protein